MKAAGIMRFSGRFIIAVLVMAGTISVQAASSKTIQVNVGEGIAQTIENIGKLAVADPTVADVAPLSENEISVIGKKVGATTLTVVHTEGAPTEVWRIEVGNETVISAIRDAIGPEAVQVRLIGDTLVLEGEVPTELESQRAEAIAKAFKPQLVNMLEIKSPRQIKIKVRVAEVSRNASRRIGLKWFGEAGQVQYAMNFDAVDDVVNAIGHGFIGQTPGGGVGGLGSDVSADVILQFLETKGWARTLSEPTLLTRSGTEASFLAGKEVPIVQQLENTFSVEYKEVGVRMKIKPVADSKGRINTMIQAEVSQVTEELIRGGTTGTQLPIIATRKAETTVQLNDGQTIVIGGLLDNSNSDTMRKFPWLADIPVIGALFRHKDKNYIQSELLFFMTPSLVKDVEVEAANAAQTPLLKQWNNEGESNRNVLELPDEKDDWGLHDPKDWGIPESWKKQPGDYEPVVEEPAKEPTTNFTPARPAAP